MSLFRYNSTGTTDIFHMSLSNLEKESQVANRANDDDDDDDELDTKHHHPKRRGRKSNSEENLRRTRSRNVAVDDDGHGDHGHGGGSPIEIIHTHTSPAQKPKKKTASQLEEEQLFRFEPPPFLPNATELARMNADQDKMWNMNHKLAKAQAALDQQARVLKTISETPKETELTEEDLLMLQQQSKSKNTGVSSSSSANAAGNSGQNNDDDDENGGGEQIELKFLSKLHKQPVKLRTSASAALSAVMKEYCEKHGLDVAHTKFQFDGDTLSGSQSANDYGMESGDGIDVIVKQ